MLNLLRFHLGKGTDRSRVECGLRMIVDDVYVHLQPGNFNIDWMFWVSFHGGI